MTPPPIPPQHPSRYAQQAPQGDLEKPVSVGDWMISFLIMGIPFVGIIFIFIWAFGGNAPASKQNYFRAVLLFMLIMGVLGFGIFMLAMMLGLVASQGHMPR